MSAVLCLDSIPSEVLSRGPGAVEAFHVATQTGTAPCNTARVFVVGPKGLVCTHYCIAHHFQELCSRNLPEFRKKHFRNSERLIPELFIFSGIIPEF